MQARLVAARDALRRKPFGEIAVPECYRAARLSDFPGLELHPPNRDGLYITGPAGVGKTHLATAWLANMAPSLVSIRADVPVPKYDRAFWVSVPGLLCELRATFGVPGAEQELLRRYMFAAVLLLDDLGAQKVSDWTIESLYLLVSSRLNACRPTIVTSNLKLSELDRVDSRLASRLGGMEYQELSGEDRRLRAVAPKGKP